MLKNKHLNRVLYLGLIALMTISSVPAFNSTTASAHTKTNIYKILNEQDAFATGHIDKNGDFTFTRKSFTKRKKNKPFDKRVVSNKEAQDVDNEQVRKESAHISSVKKFKKLEGKLKYWQYRAKAHPTGKTHKIEMREVHKVENEMNSVSNGVDEDNYVLHNRYAKKAWHIQEHAIKNDKKILNDSRASAKAKADARKDMDKNEKTMAASKAAVKENDEWNYKFAGEEEKLADELNSPKTNTYIPEGNGRQAAQGLSGGVMPWQVRQNPRWYGRGYIEGLESIGWSSHNARTAWRLLSNAVKRHPNRSSFWISENAYTGAPEVSSD